MPRSKNGESSDSGNVQRSKESSIVQIPTGTNTDCRIYSANNAASNVTAVTPMSPPIPRRNDGCSNGGGAEVIQRQTVWPTAITTIDPHNGGDETDNEGKSRHLFK